VSAGSIRRLNAIQALHQLLNLASAARAANTTSRQAPVALGEQSGGGQWGQW